MDSDQSSSKLLAVKWDLEEERVVHKRERERGRGKDGGGTPSSSF